MATTYLELVNNAILESGVDLDPLISSNFAAPPAQSSYLRFKKWVQDAYKELQIAADDWEFKSGRATVFIYPSMYIEHGSRATAPPVDSVYLGNDTSSSFNVASSILHSGTWSGGDAKATLFFKTAEDRFKYNELFDEVLPTPAAGVFRTKGRGRYNFTLDGQVTDIANINFSTMMVSSTGGSSIQSNDNSTFSTNLIEIPWTLWKDTYEGDDGFGMPRFFVVTPDGDLDFHPKPDKQYVLQFTYSKSSDTMTLYNDTPGKIPNDYQDILYWAAVMKYGLYDRQAAIVAKGQKMYDFYRNLLEKNSRPMPTFEPSRFNRNVY